MTLIRACLGSRKQQRSSSRGRSSNQHLMISHACHPNNKAACQQSSSPEQHLWYGMHLYSDIRDASNPNPLLPFRPCISTPIEARVKGEKDHSHDQESFDYYIYKSTPYRSQLTSSFAQETPTPKKKKKKIPLRSSYVRYARKKPRTPSAN